MILFRALSRFRALFDGDGLSAQNRDITVFGIYVFEILNYFWKLGAGASLGGAGKHAV